MYNQRNLFCGSRIIKFTLHFRAFSPWFALCEVPVSPRGWWLLLTIIQQRCSWCSCFWEPRLKHTQIPASCENISFPVAQSGFPESGSMDGHHAVPSQGRRSSLKRVDFLFLEPGQCQSSASLFQLCDRHSWKRGLAVPGTSGTALLLVNVRAQPHPGSVQGPLLPLMHLFSPHLDSRARFITRFLSYCA